MTRFDRVKAVILSDVSLTQNIAATMAAVVVPTAARWALGPSADPVPFVTYFPFVLLVAVFLGWKWAAAATVVSAILVSRVFLTSPWFGGAEPPELAVFAYFVLSCAVLILIGDTLRRTVRQMDRLSRERERLSDEMYHRVQNTFAVVDGLVRMSAASDLAQFRADLLGRIQALAAANRVLREGADGGSPVRELIQRTTAPFGCGEAFTLQGPDHVLPAETAHQLLLLLHELCTNALKHGALSAPEGRVSISWTDGGKAFSLEWREAGGPAVKPPSRKGLGSKLLATQRVFRVEIAYEPGGVIGRLSLLSEANGDY